MSVFGTHSCGNHEFVLGLAGLDWTILGSPLYPTHVLQPYLFPAPFPMGQRKGTEQEGAHLAELGWECPDPSPGYTHPCGFHTFLQDRFIKYC